MSQKKVDAYKARKGLHNKTDRKEKVLFGLEMFAWAFICVVIVAWIGYSAYVKVTGAKENVVQNTVMDTTALGQLHFESVNRCIRWYRQH